MQSGSLVLLQRCSRYILLLQPTWPLEEGSFCRGAVGLFLQSRTTAPLVKEVFHSAEMQLVYSTALTGWLTCEESLTPLWRCSLCILHSQSTWPRVKGVLPFCGDAVGVFCIPSRLGHALRESYHSAEMQSVYSAAPADWPYYNLVPIRENI